MVTATKSSELVLSEEAKGLYEKCWKIADEALGTLEKQKEVKAWMGDWARERLKEIKDPYRYSETIKAGRMFRLGNSPLVRYLDNHFAEENNLPLSIQSRDHFMQVLEYVKKNHGMETQGLRILKSYDGDWHGSREKDGTRVLYYAQESAISSIGAILHEMDHIRDESARRLALFWEDLHKFRTGGEDAKRLRRAMQRYSEGKATFAETELLSSKDAFVRAFYAISFMDKIATPLPAFYKHKHGMGDYDHPQDKYLNFDVWRDEAGKARRYSEGFRDYYTLQAIVGKERLDDFEKRCKARGLFLGIEEANLVVVGQKEVKMYGVSLEKFKTGITDIDELIRKAPKLPDKMG